MQLYKGYQGRDFSDLSTSRAKSWIDQLFVELYEDSIHLMIDLNLSP